MVAFEIVFISSVYQRNSENIFTRAAGINIFFYLDRTGRLFESQTLLVFLLIIASCSVMNCSIQYQSVLKSAPALLVKRLPVFSLSMLRRDGIASLPAKSAFPTSAQDFKHNIKNTRSCCQGREPREPGCISAAGPFYSKPNKRVVKGVLLVQDNTLLGKQELTSPYQTKYSFNDVVKLNIQLDIIQTISEINLRNVCNVALISLL